MSRDTQSGPILSGKDLKKSTETTGLYYMKSLDPPTFNKVRLVTVTFLPLLVLLRNIQGVFRKFLLLKK